MKAAPKASAEAKAIGGLAPVEPKDRASRETKRVRPGWPLGSSWGWRPSCRCSRAGGTAPNFSGESVRKCSHKKEITGYQSKGDMSHRGYSQHIRICDEQVQRYVSPENVTSHCWQLVPQYPMETTGIFSHGDRNWRQRDHTYPMGMCANASPSKRSTPHPGDQLLPG